MTQCLLRPPHPVTPVRTETLVDNLNYTPPAAFHPPVVVQPVNQGPKACKYDHGWWLSLLQKLKVCRRRNRDPDERSRSGEVVRLSGALVVIPCGRLLQPHVALS